MSQRRKMLCVFAHPDDESYGPGGTIARYALEGVEVNLLMFTCGEAGSIGVSKNIPNDELCRLRTAELNAACEALGIGEHRILGVPDKGVGAMDQSRAIAEVVSDIRRFQPQVLLTFHHLGISGHPDHIAVATVLERAFEQTSGDSAPPLKLYGYGIPEHKARLYQRDNLVPLKKDDVDAVIDIPDEAMDNKILAIRRHETQYDFYRSLQEKFDYRTVARPEHFHLRKTRLPRLPRLPRPRPGDFEVESDLFEGIVP